MGWTKKDTILAIGIIVGIILIVIPEPATTVTGIMIVLACLIMWGIKGLPKA